MTARAKKTYSHKWFVTAVTKDGEERTSWGKAGSLALAEKAKASCISGFLAPRSKGYFTVTASGIEAL